MFKNANYPNPSSSERPGSNAQSVEIGAGVNSAGSSVPAISLPKGGGAIHGIGEKFTANPATGTGSMIVPMAISPSRSGFAPQLSLAYDSGAVNGPFGFGWSLSLPAITRKTDKELPHPLARPDVLGFIARGIGLLGLHVYPSTKSSTACKKKCLTLSRHSSKKPC